MHTYAGSKKQGSGSRGWIAKTAKIGFPQEYPYVATGYAAQAVGIIGAIKSATYSSKST